MGGRPWMRMSAAAGFAGGLALMCGGPGARADPPPPPELTDADAVAAAVAPIDPARLSERRVLGTLGGHPLTMEYRCDGLCPAGAYRVLHYDLHEDLDNCEAWGGAWTELPTQPGRQELFCIPRKVRYAQELAQAKRLTADDLAALGAGGEWPPVAGGVHVLGRFNDVLVRIERHSYDIGAFGTTTLWLDPPEGETCEAAGGVTRVRTVARGITSSRDAFCIPKPYDDAEQAADQRREHETLKQLGR